MKASRLIRDGCWCSRSQHSPSYVSLEFCAFLLHACDIILSLRFIWQGMAVASRIDRNAWIRQRLPSRLVLLLEAFKPR
jgi:hypothetical protein